MYSTYGLLETPVITNHGMITGLTIDGYYKFMPNPVINMSDFLRPKYETKRETSTNIGTYYENLPPKKTEATYSEKDLMKVKLESIEQEKKLLEVQFENEKKKNQELLTKLDNEKKERLSDEKQKTKLTTEKLDEFNKMMRNIAFKNFKNTGSSASSFSLPSTTGTRSNATSVSSSVSRVSSHVSSVDYPESVFSSMSDVRNPSDYENDFDDSVSQISCNSDDTVVEQDDIERLNGRSKNSNCICCQMCHKGVVSVGTIFVNEKDNDYNFVIGFNKYEKYYCDFGQKLKSLGKKMETPVMRAQKALKRMTGITYNLDGNEFFDIPIKDTVHVHRIYVIRMNNVDLSEFKTSDEITEYSVFSFKNMDEKYTEFTNRIIINNNNKPCKINKRIQKFFNMFYEVHVD
jgi:hypothetical protein